MKRPAFSTWLIALSSICTAAGAARAQTPPVYRCGSSYSQSPCAEGRAVDVDDSRSAGQRAEAALVSAETKRAATRMERDRLAEEARLKPAGAARLSGDPGASPAPLVRHVKKPKKAAAVRRASWAALATVDPAAGVKKRRQAR